MSSGFMPNLERLNKKELLLIIGLMPAALKDLQDMQDRKVMRKEMADAIRKHIQDAPNLSHRRVPITMDSGVACLQ